ncbi:MAG: OmpA family protein [Bacteroidota bacterium]|nr:OmpA family protein [Bacteroidota bacterium]
MKKQYLHFLSLIAISFLIASCASMTKTQKGGVIGAAGGGAIGAVIGKTLGNTGLGAIIGAGVGGVTGVLIGKQMDKQAADMKKNLPNAKVERVGEGIVVELSEKILFGFNRSDLESEAMRNLDKIIAVLQNYPETNVEIQGHTDNKGTDEYNMDLSKRRASSVYAYFYQRGLPASRFTIVGYGESLPKYSNESKSGQAQNRRVEFLISANEKMKEAARKEAEGK